MVRRDPLHREAGAQDARVAHRAGQEPIEDGGVDALPFGDRAGLGDRDHRRSRDQVVAELRGLAGPGGPDVNDEAAERREQRPVRREGIAASSDHDGERAGFGRTRPAADRRVERVDAEPAQLSPSFRASVGGPVDMSTTENPGGLPPGGRRIRGRPPRRPRATAGRRATSHLSAASAGVAATGAPRSAARDGIDVDGDQLVPGRDEVPGHRQSHRPEPDERDPRHGLDGARGELAAERRETSEWAPRGGEGDPDDDLVVARGVGYPHLERL